MLGGPLRRRSKRVKLPLERNEARRSSKNSAIAIGIATSKARMRRISRESLLRTEEARLLIATPLNIKLKILHKRDGQINSV